MAWRDVRAAARSVVHETMKVRCLYLAGGIPLDSNSSSDLDSNSGDVEYPELQVRIHENQTRLGDQAGTSLNSAERFEPIPQIIFWKADLETAGVSLAHGDVLSVSQGEAYHLDVIEPHDQETVKARVTRLSATESEGLPLPEA